MRIPEWDAYLGIRPISEQGGLGSCARARTGGRKKVARHIKLYLKLLIDICWPSLAKQ